jgi:DNA invertase Pin-like site-specific DNA recombinase
MMALIRKRQCDVLLVYRYDRFARSLHHLVSSLAEFDSLGVQFVSLHEGVDTSTPNGRLIFHIFASIAEFERELIRERVKSGIANARAKGVRLGRPRRVADALKIRMLRSAGEPWHAVAKQAGVSIATAKRIAKNAPELPERLNIPISTGQNGKHAKRKHVSERTRS